MNDVECYTLLTSTRTDGGRTIRHEIASNGNGDDVLVRLRNGYRFCERFM